MRVIAQITCPTPSGIDTIMQFLVYFIEFFNYKEDCFWTYIIEITYYSGEKKRQFKVNIDNGKITHL